MGSTQTTFKPGDLAFGALLSGALASAAVALLFLIIDSFRGDPFLTPSVMGSAVFLGSVPDADAPVRLGMVAMYTLVHLSVFLCVGVATTLSAARMPDLAGGVVLLPAFVFAILTAGIYAFDALFRPGIVQAVGVGYLMLGNLVAAWVMGWFVSATLRDSDLVAAPASAGGASSGR